MEIFKHRGLLLPVCIFLVLSIFVYFLYDSFGQNLRKIMQADTNGDCEDGGNIVSNEKDYIVNDLSGAVNRPGVYTLEEGSRVVDLVRHGEGFTSVASTEWVAKKLNLSQKLTDSQKVYVPFEWEIIGSCYEDTLEIEDIESSTTIKTEKDLGSSASDADKDKGTSTGKINVNSADIEDLDTLSGIGPVYAQKIIDNRPYKDVEELKSKTGISQTTIDKFISQITF